MAAKEETYPYFSAQLTGADGEHLASNLLGCSPQVAHNQAAAFVERNLFGVPHRIEILQHDYAAAPGKKLSYKDMVRYAKNVDPRHRCFLCAGAG